MRFKFAVFVIVVFMALALALSSPVAAFEEDCKGIVTKVVDGDTIYVRCLSGFKAGEVFKVRFADVNAPELETPEGEIAKSALYNLIYGKTVVLDVDDLHVYDKYGRVVAVVYLELNETTLLNVNLWLVVNGYAEITDYPNEFNPYSWSLYVTLTYIPSRLTWIERDLPDKPIDAEEVFTVTLTKDLSRIVLPAIYSIDELKAYEVVPPGIEVLDPGPGRLIRIRLNELREWVNSKVMDVISEFRENISMGIVKIPEIPYLPDLLPRSYDYVTLIEFDFTNIDEAIYKARVVDVAPYEPLKIFHGATLMVVKDTSGKEYSIPGAIRGDAFLWVKPPVRILASTSSKVEITLRVHEVHERNLKSIILNLTRKLAPELNYIEISLDKPFTTSIPIIANLSDFTENGRLMRPIELTIVNETDNTMIRVVLPQDLKLSKPLLTIKPIVAPPSTPPWIVRAMPVIDISVPNSPSKPVKIEFKYNEDVVRALGLREDLLKIIYFNEDLGAWISMPSNVDPSRNLVWAYVSHFTMFSIAQLSSGVEGYVLDEATGEPIQGAKIIAVRGSKIAEATTDERGHYYVSLAPDTYTIIVCARGYVDDASRASVSPGEITRLDFNLKRATAEFEESWAGVDFELAIITSQIWEIGKTVNLTASIVVTDMGDNLGVSFKALELALSGIEVRVPIDVTLVSPGKAFNKTIEINVVDDFSTLKPGTLSPYMLEISLQGSITNKYGQVWDMPHVPNLMKIYVEAPSIPLAVEAETPEIVHIGDEFNVTIRLRNDGEWPITNIELELLTPFGTDLLSPSEWSLAQLNPGEEAKATFKLKANLATTSSIAINLAYTTFYGYREYEFSKDIAILTIRKIPTSIAITIEPSEVDVGGEVTIKGSITPPMSALIMLTIKKPDGTTETMMTTSGVDGGFSFKVRLDQEGTWTFIASYPGSATYEESMSTSIQATAKPKKCLIATAAFGTELAKPVQFLREFRDKIVMRTFAGKCFMQVFNAWYYSWAPYVAQAEWSCKPLRQAVKYAIYPLIGALHVATATYQIFSFNPEAGVIMAGIIASALIGLIYFTPITIAASIALNRAPSKRTIKATTTAWLTSIAGTAISTITQSTIPAMTFTSILVLTTIALTTAITTKITTQKLQKHINP